MMIKNAYYENPDPRAPFLLKMGLNPNPTKLYLLSSAISTPLSAALHANSMCFCITPCYVSYGLKRYPLSGNAEWRDGLWQIYISHDYDSTLHWALGVTANPGSRSQRGVYFWHSIQSSLNAVSSTFKSCLKFTTAIWRQEVIFLLYCTLVWWKRQAFSGEAMRWPPESFCSGNT